MGKQRYVDTFFWDDGFILKLDPVEKLLYLYLLTNPLTNICGIYEISLERIAFDTGINQDMIVKILKRLQGSKRLKYSKGYVAIRKFIKHQAKNSKIRKGIELLLEKAPKRLVQWVKGCAIDSSSRDIDNPSHTNPNVNFNYKKGKFEGMTQEYFEELKKNYPGVDIDFEMQKMCNWLQDNPQKKRQGKRSFISNWLKRGNESSKELESEGVPRLKQGDYSGR